MRRFYSWHFLVFVLGLVISMSSPSAFAAECESELDSRLIKVDEFKNDDFVYMVGQAQSEITYAKSRIESWTEELSKLQDQKKPRTKDIENAKDRLSYWELEIEKSEERLTYFQEQAKKTINSLVEAKAEVEEKILRTPELGIYLQDAINFEQLKRLPNHQVVSLLWGSPHDQPSEDEIQAVREILSDLSAKGYLILLDGHALITPKIIDAANGQALALASSPVETLSPEETFVISNRYLLAQSFADRYRVTASSNSLMGAALAIYGKVNSFLDVKAGPVAKSFEDFTKWSLVASGRDLRLSPIQSPWVLKPDQYGKDSGRFPKLGRLHRPIQRTFRELDIRELRDFGYTANQMYSGQSQAGGVDGVLFGSGSMVEWSSALIYKVAYEMGKQGVGVATGGSGGAMLAANMGAYDAGGLSLGIPMGGLRREGRTYSEFQTATVAASGYAERIPWLLNGRKLIINAPGGNGTIREIVMGLVWLAQEKNPEQVIVFLDKGYYGGLIEALSALSLNPEILSRIAVVDDVEEFQQAMKNFESEGKFEFNNAGSVSQPRSERNELPEDLYKPKPPPEKRTQKRRRRKSCQKSRQSNLIWLSG